MTRKQVRSTVRRALGDEAKQVHVRVRRRGGRCDVALSMRDRQYGQPTAKLVLARTHTWSGAAPAALAALSRLRA